jgi:hypothetical protein
MQKQLRRVSVLAAFLCGAFYISRFSTGAQSVSPPPKMATEIPPNIMTPNSVATSLGTLKFFGGLPDKQTVRKIYENLKALQ